jgi:hypothetical protein
MVVYADVDADILSNLKCLLMGHARSGIGSLFIGHLDGGMKILFGLRGEGTVDATDVVAAVVLVAVVHPIVVRRGAPCVDVATYLSAEADMICR